MTAITEWPWRYWAERQPQQVALRNEQGVLSWAELAGQVEELAAGFMRQGVYLGCGVALKARSSQQALLAYLALLQCGARVLPLNPQLPAGQLTALLPALNCEFALALEGEPLPSLTALTFRSLTFRASYSWDARQIATLTLTSGSSGLPKAAAHTFSAHLASAAGVISALNFTSAESWLLSLPLYHVSGQGIVWRWLLSGAGLGIVGQRPLHQALETCTFASLVPAQLWRLLQRPSLPATLHSVLLGGAAIPTALTQQAEVRGIACWCGYGMTETASTVAAKRADGLPGVGRVLPGHSIQVVAGEVQLRSPALACGYWQHGNLTALSDAQGWFATRDSGEIKEGELVLHGRLDNQFFSAGEGVQPEFVESVLLQHPAVTQAFIVPLEDVEYGHRPVALVTTRGALTLPALAEWAATRLTGFQRPQRWYTLPDLQSGGIKISRQALINWVAEQEKRRH
ncbi:o-succinylbenzoate--CoA ligase [Erwinia pyri]|uniref:O-succinylbenzoate--CoA ligase n=1 Tax=Erwinia pyri TaxID=3062598 RepID=A0AA50DLT8_9GAMM|nr:o-succinylbenzoate--CoA ligase [Erwinia sp. DE2]WLS80185.1 o-succinylbenzoate--CoA ligase [Erwinia sp. DE2]